jgi:hypothetical protein
MICLVSTGVQLFPDRPQWVNCRHINSDCSTGGYAMRSSPSLLFLAFVSVRPEAVPRVNYHKTNTAIYLNSPTLIYHQKRFEMFGTLSIL